MLKKHKNQIFDFFKNHKLGLDHFDLVSVEENLETIITYKQTPLKFFIRESKEDFNSFAFAFTKFSKNFPKQGYWGGYNIDTILRKITDWINTDVDEYRIEQDSPDLWEEYKKGNKTLNPENVNFEEQEDFTIDEKKQVILAINELKMLIQRDLQTTIEEQKVVDARLDYLVDAVDRLNKFDWKGVMWQVLMSIAINLSFDTEKGRQLFELAKKVFAVIPQIPRIVGH